MIYTADMFTAEAALATDGRLYADPATGRVSGRVAGWGQCLRGTGASVCVALQPEGTDLEAWRQSLVTLDTGDVIAAGAMALGPAHPNPGRKDAPTVMHELRRPEHLAVLAVPHATADGVVIAGAIAPEAIDRWGSVEAAAEAINRAAWSVHAGPSADNPGRRELWGIVAVVSPGLPQAAPPFALAAACSADGESCEPCEACAAAADVSRETSADIDAIADRVVERLAEADEQRRMREALASVQTLPPLG